MIAQLSKHLGLTAPPSRTDLILCNANDVPLEWESAGRGAVDLIRDVRADLVIIDSLTAFFPEIEDKNSIATRKLKELREVIRATGCSLDFVHHLRKPADVPGYKPEKLEDGDLRKWFLQTRGPRSLVNGSDLRLAVDVPTSVPRGAVGSEQDFLHPALVVRGFRRVQGEIPTLYLARVFDANGEPRGYQQLSGAGLLFNVEQENAFGKLPPEFTPKQARLIYGKGSEAVNLFLNKCVAVGILRNVSRGSWQKTGI